MAKSAAEYQRAYRERLKARRELAPDQSFDLVRRPLAEFMDGATLLFDESLDSLGVHIDGRLGDDVQTFRSDGLGPLSMPGLKRLESLAGAFLDAAMELHVLINAYKSQEARDRLAELGDEDIRSSEKRHRALASAVRLDAILAALSKSTRRDFPAIEVKGVER